MTGTLLGEVPGARKGRNQMGSRSYTRIFKLDSDDILDDAYIMGSVVGLPVIGDVYASDVYAYCKSVNIECTAPWRGWEYTAEYDTDVGFISSVSPVGTSPTGSGGSDPAGPKPKIDKDPLQDTPGIGWHSEQSQVIATDGILQGDLLSSKIVNTAGDPFDPPVMKDDSRWICTISGNLNVGIDQMKYWINKVNKDTIVIDGLTVLPACAKIQSISVGRPQIRNSIFFTEVQIVIAVHLQDIKAAAPIQVDNLVINPVDPAIVNPVAARRIFDFRIANVGFRELVADTRIAITDDDDAGNKIPIAAPVGLNDDGTRTIIEAGGIPIPFNYRQYAVYEEMDFSIIPLL